MHLKGLQDKSVTQRTTSRTEQYHEHFPSTGHSGTMDSNPSTRWLASDIESQPELGPEAGKFPAEAWTNVETTAHSSSPKKRKLREMNQPSCNTDSNELQVPNIQALCIALENYDDHSNRTKLLDVAGLHPESGAEKRSTERRVGTESQTGTCLEAFQSKIQSAALRGRGFTAL